MSLSAEHAKGFYAHGLSHERLDYFKEIAGRSIADQVVIQSSDKMGFDEFLQAYMIAN